MMTDRRLCARCGVAYAKLTGRWCGPCYATGEAQPVDSSTVAQHVTALRQAGWTLAGIADEVGCVTRWRLSDVLHGKTRTTRRHIAEAVLSIPLPDDSACVTCEDVDVALMSTSDPQMIAERLQTTPGALSRHLYRHGRPDVARIFAKPNTAQRYERTRA